MDRRTSKHSDVTLAAMAHTTSASGILEDLPPRHPQRVAIVVPVYNEEDAIAPFLDAVGRVIDPLASEGLSFEIIFVDDGSSDSTLATLIGTQRHEPRIRIIELSRRFGKEAALTAGFDACTTDAAIPIDADLQDPPNLIPSLIDKWREGYEVVLACRTDRSSDAFLKRKMASWFYKVHNKIAAERIPEDVGDFRLMDRQVLDSLKCLPERRRFMKGLLSWVGFRTATVSYVREKRIAGRSKFSGWRLWSFALEGITSFSTVPLEIWTYLGAIISSLTLLYSCFIVVRTLVFGIDVPGYASLLISVLFLGGVQLTSIGIVGQYVGRIYAETKQRPVYIVRRTYWGEE